MRPGRFQPRKTSPLPQKPCARAASMRPGRFQPRKPFRNPKVIPLLPPRFKEAGAFSAPEALMLTRTLA